ncbi:SHOCT domain-containing protein [Rhodococcus sp. ACT016]|uniref:SHOCT domain-containing protein n=1 Tax=Rhodococcus sp. ACT016 TaxID=3134808 RepID=UPI003D2A9D61
MDSFWEFFWVVLACFAFGAYLIVLLAIFADLFRDHETRGWAKAAWVLFLFVVPFFSALIYLIVKGEGMAHRSRAASERIAERQDEYVQRVVGKSRAEQIADAERLRSAGVISDEDFQARKAKALS